MRKKGIIAVIVFLLLILVLTFVFSDSWVEHRIEKTAAGIVGAKVEIDNLDINLLKLRVSWQRLQVADPADTWQNLIETGQADFDIATEPLFYGRWIVEDFRLQDLRSGTKRETDGKLPEKQVYRSDEPTVFDQTAARLHAELQQTTGIDFSRLNRSVNVDSLIQILDLRTPGKIDSFRTDIQQTTNYWQNKIDSISTLETEAKGMVARLQRIKMDQLKTVKDVTQTVSTLQSVKGQVDSIRNVLQTGRDNFVQDWQRLNNQLTAVDNWIRSDIQRTAARANLPDFSVSNIARILFGPALFANIDKGIRYFNVAQRYVKKMAPTDKVESPPRFAGQDIRFPDRRGWPKFWLKNALISGETGSSAEDRGFILSGEIQNITTDQRIIGTPTIVQLSSEKENRTAYDISAVIDRTSDIPKEKFNIKVSRISLNNAELGGSGFLPKKADKGSMNVDIDVALNGSFLDGKLGVTASNVAFDFSSQNSKNRFEQIARDILQSIKQIDLTMKFSGEPQNLKIQLNSNLDNLFANRFKSIVSDQVQQARSEIEKRVQARLQPHKQEAAQFYQQKRDEVDKKLAAVENQVNDQIKLIEDKRNELQQRIENEKKNLLDNLKGKLKDIFKKE